MLSNLQKLGYILIYPIYSWNVPPSAGCVTCVNKPFHKPRSLAMLAVLKRKYGSALVDKSLDGREFREAIVMWGMITLHSPIGFLSVYM